MKALFFLSFLFCGFFNFGCSQNITADTKEKNTGGLCPDSVIAYKRSTMPGTQQTDLDGNPIHKTMLHYRIYLRSNSKNILIDSLEIGQKRVTGFKYTLVQETPLYWNGPNEKILLVTRTNCPVYEIVFDYSVNKQLSQEEEDHIALYYSHNGQPVKRSAEKVTILPQMVTE